jgi:hypothetical protein
MLSNRVIPDDRTIRQYLVGFDAITPFVDTIETTIKSQRNRATVIIDKTDYDRLDRHIR